jgi:hypothetical protein
VDGVDRLATREDGRLEFDVATVKGSNVAETVPGDPPSIATNTVP